MTQTQDLCPISDTGNHRYFIFKVVEVFEPYKIPEDYLIHDEVKEFVEQFNKTDTLYQKVEYAVSGCNCGSAVRQRVKQQ